MVICNSSFLKAIFLITNIKFMDKVEVVLGRVESYKR